MLLYVLVAGILLSSGCVTWQSSEYLRLDQQAVQGGFSKTLIQAPPFMLTAYQKVTSRADIMTVYIEGDGRAWASRELPSDDPTPRDPIAFELAAQDTAPVIVYLARPGQFLSVGAQAVDPAYWLAKRYSEEVVQAMGQAIDQMKQLTGATKITMVGYSGGAAIAALLAARRDDVIALRTVAGNLSLKSFSKFHHVSPLTGSLDPLAVAEKIKTVPQRHFIGTRDEIIPRIIIEEFVSREGDVFGESVSEIKGIGHSRGWPEVWRELLREPLISQEKSD